MSLADFKSKYHRQVEGHDKPAPYCSGDERSPFLLFEPWMADAGMVHCSTYFPFEKVFDRTPTTVAGVPTENVVYKFLDGRLFQVLVAFPTDFFDEVREAIEAKYGEPDNSERKRRFIWTNYVSAIHLMRGKVRPQEPSVLTFSHIELAARAAEQQPGPAVDDL